MSPLEVVNYNFAYSSMDDRSISSTASSYPVNRVVEKKSQSAASKTKTVKKGVTFKSAVRVRKISSHRSFSEEERANMWYSSLESKALRKDAVKTVKKMMKGIDVDADEDDCSRGLEFKTPKRNKIRQARKEEIMYSVLMEQEKQLDEQGEVDARYLADVYISCSRPCMKEAHKRGLSDEIEALRAAMQGSSLSR